MVPAAQNPRAHEEERDNLNESCPPESPDHVSITSAIFESWGIPSCSDNEP